MSAASTNEKKRKSVAKDATKPEKRVKKTTPKEAEETKVSKARAAVETILSGNATEIPKDLKIAAVMMNSILRSVFNGDEDLYRTALEDRGLLREDGEMARELHVCLFGNDADRKKMDKHFKGMFDQFIEDTAPHAPHRKAQLQATKAPKKSESKLMSELEKMDFATFERLYKIRLANQVINQFYY